MELESYLNILDKTMYDSFDLEFQITFYQLKSEGGQTFCKTGIVHFVSAIFIYMHKIYSGKS